MSRIIIKGLPPNIKEESLRKKVSTAGTVTDCCLKYTRDGVFRKFAFVGYTTEEEAQKAVNLFHKSFVDTAKVEVEIAKNFGDTTKPRSWSKYSRDSSAYQKMIKILEERKEKEQEKIAAKKESKSAKKHKNREDKMADLLGDLKGNPEFEEFVEAHRNRATKATWSNDGGHVTGKEDNGQSLVEKMAFDEDSDEGVGQSEEAASDDDSSDEESSGGKDAEMEDVKSENLAKKSDMSDVDYLKSKVAKKSKLFESSDSSSDDESDSEETEEKSGKKPQKARSANKPPQPGSSKGTGDAESSSDDEDEEEDDDGEDDEEEEGQGNTAECSEKSTLVKHVVKLRGLPPNAREQEVKRFFAPTEAVRIKIPKNVRGKANNGIATVEFKSEKDIDQAMRKNKNFIGPKRILLYKVKKEAKEEVVQKPRPWEHKGKEAEDPEGEETIAESGRLYIRNLAFVCKEDDLEAHFGKYGPLTEVNMPIDKLTRKPKGFAFITFMMPEHAVKAFTDLDGSVFQGRMLHILPGRAKKEETEDSDNMSYKKKKDLKQKAEASSSHNWNTLFLGANAVADVMAEKYGTSKSDILDPASKQSLAVRMALGETQIVAETRDFLLKNGVALDAFSQAAAARSKTVILVKNLPAGTTAGELRNIFGRHGQLDRVVMPPSGVTGIVEYTEPSEARVGFRSLAYTKFQHVPLFLEWAPVNVYTTPTRAKEAEDKGRGKVEEAGGKDAAGEGESSSESEDEVEPESTLYVKNLNFDTTEKTLREAFEKCGPLRNVTIAKKKDMKNAGQLLSMGYGFVEFRRQVSAQKAMKTMQLTQLEDHQIELKISNRATTMKPVSARKKQDTTKKQKSSKILVRNIPFEAKAKEIKELFSTFGELKTVRLPKKLGGTGSHRGFCFVDFLTRQDAKRAFKALCHSTRLYGRRLVLEWADADDTVDQLRKKTADHFHEEGPAKRLKKSDLMNELKLSVDG